jgi:hypothetical protein
MAADSRLGLVGELVAASDRDLAVYRATDSDDPNRLNAGRSALHGLESAIQRLMEVRAGLLRELGGEQPEANR